MASCTIFQNEENKNNIKKDPVNYLIEEIPKEKKMDIPSSNYKIKNNKFKSNLNEIISLYKWIEISSFKLYFKKNSIQCLYIKNKSLPSSNSKIILFSQSEATNLSSILPFLVNFSTTFKINILTYEYNTLKKEDKICYDLKTLFVYLSKLNYIQEIILIGVSVGTIANFSIFSSDVFKKEKIKGIIVISPSWVYNQKNLKNKNSPNEIKNHFNSIFNLINKEKIPVFLIHGKKDIIVRYFLSLSFGQRFNYKKEWYPKNGDHFNILNELREKLYIKIKKFLDNLGNENFFEVKHKNEIVETNLEENKLIFNEMYNSNISGNFGMKINNNDNNNENSNSDNTIQKDDDFNNENKCFENIIINNVNNNIENLSNKSIFLPGEIIPINCTFFDKNEYINKFSINNVNTTFSVNNYDNNNNLNEISFNNKNNNDNNFNNGSFNYIEYNTSVNNALDSSFKMNQNNE